MPTRYLHGIFQVPQTIEGTSVLDEMKEAEVFEVLHQRLCDEPVEVEIQVCTVWCIALSLYRW